MQSIITGGCISADSHVLEAPDTYTSYIDPKFRDRAPHVITNAKGHEVYVVPGLTMEAPLVLLGGAGASPEKLAEFRAGAKFTDVHKSGYDSTYRVADQKTDGIAGEILYASIGMVLCHHPDFELKNACFKAYNRWLAEFCSNAPDRLFGLAMTAVTSAEEAIEDVRRAKEMGFVGMMMSGDPQHEDYDHPMYDPLWECAADLQMPICFHILTSKGSGPTELFQGARGHKVNGHMNMIRGVQDIVGLFVLSGVFERHPNLKLVSAESDAGWVAHYMNRMDKSYENHCFHLGGRTIPRPPSEYIRESVYFTFQDDSVAFKCADLVNPKHLLWANDFPHSDSTWPRSQALLTEHTQCISEEQRNWILRDNVKELFQLPC